MNVFDFDGTIYENDSPTDFYFFLINNKKRKDLLRYLPSVLIDAVKYGVKAIDNTKLKETFYRYLNAFKDGEIDELVREFWDTKGYKKIYKWYLDMKASEDVVVSASPRWLLTPMVCGKLKIKHLLCSEMDKRNGDYIGINCYGVEKVSRFYKSFPDAVIDNFYSDSDSDLPLAKHAKAAFKILKGGKIINWDIK